MISTGRLAEKLYPKVFRTDFQQPGFAHVSLGRDVDSAGQRGLMIDLKEKFSEIHRKRFTRELSWQSLGRFDQQMTTRPHRDGGPDESILILGYEPTQIRSQVTILDYSRCAFDMGITPSAFLKLHNPMLPDGQSLLARYTTPVTEFDHTRFQLLIINNSSSPCGDNRLQGVLHTAEILNPAPNEQRVVNSTMVASFHEIQSDVSANEVERFRTTTLVS